MAIQSIQNYLLGTREPIDYVGKALDAFATVNSQLLQTRQQNLAEQKDARQAGDQRREGMQDVQNHQQDMVDRQFSRELALEDQEMQRTRLGMEMAKMGMQQEQQRWEMENLMPLKMQALQADIASQRQATAIEAENQKINLSLRDSLNSTINNIDGVLSGTHRS